MWLHIGQIQVQLLKNNNQTELLIFMILFCVFLLSDFFLITSVILFYVQVIVIFNFTVIVEIWTVFIDFCPYLIICQLMVLK